MHAFWLFSVMVIAAAWGYGLGDRTSAARTNQRPNLIFVLTDRPESRDGAVHAARHRPRARRRDLRPLHPLQLVVLSLTQLHLHRPVPHDGGDYTNIGTDGGYYAFTHNKPNLETRAFAAAVQHAGYLTSMMGKYLNGYDEPAMTTQVPRG
jgi:N-acetylglucosamine-6-sulfatase